MKMTWLPVYHRHVLASEMQPRRFWLHAFMVLGIFGVLALPRVRAWTEVDPWVCLVFILVHLLIFGGRSISGIYRRFPTLWSTVYVTWNLVSAVGIAILPGKMVLPLWSLYGTHVLCLTRAVTLSPYLIALIVSVPFLGGLVSQLSGTGLLTNAWPQLALVSMSGGALYLTLAPSIEHQRRIQAELATASRGQGLASMEARASWLGARLTITSSPSSGTTVEVRGRRELVT